MASARSMPSMPASAWSLLRAPLFRMMWIAALTSDAGTFMQNVAASWLMTSLTRSPLLIALMQTAASLPVFVLGLPAGALADIVDRRRLLLATQGAALVVAGLLGALTLAGATTPALLLALTFLLGLTAALSIPAFKAVVPEIVPPGELAAGISLYSIENNLARVVGPALGGLLAGLAGPGFVFVLNAASFLTALLALGRWRRPPRMSALPAERVLGAIRAGLRYVRYAPSVQAVLVRAGCFGFFSSGVFALLPLLVRRELRLDSTAYGALFALLGLGGVLGAALLPRVRRRLPAEWLLAGSALAFALAGVALAYVRNLGVLSVAMTLAGLAFLALLVTLNIQAQMAAPAWARARVLGIYLLVFQGAMALGSVLWGALAGRAGLSATLLAAAIGLVVSLTAAAWWHPAPEAGEAVPQPMMMAMMGMMATQEPSLMLELNAEEGPVCVTVDYRIEPPRAPEFRQAMRTLERVRRRDGAIRWALLRDPADARHYVESYVVESWAEHLRQQERMTPADRAVEGRAAAFHTGEAPPADAHLVVQPLGSRRAASLPGAARTSPGG